MTLSRTYPSCEEATLGDICVQTTYYARCALHESAQDPSMSWDSRRSSWARLRKGTAGQNIKCSPPIGIYFAHSPSVFTKLGKDWSKLTLRAVSALCSLELPLPKFAIRHSAFPVGIGQSGVAISAVWLITTTNWRSDD